MEIELFIGLYVVMCIGMAISAYFAVKEDNYKAFAIIIVCFVIGTVILFGIATYMAPSWVSESLSDVVISH